MELIRNTKVINRFKLCVPWQEGAMVSIINYFCSMISKFDKKISNIIKCIVLLFFNSAFGCFSNHHLDRIIVRYMEALPKPDVSYQEKFFSVQLLRTATKNLKFLLNSMNQFNKESVLSFLSSLPSALSVASAY